ncbi:hypothetical protein [Glaciihabitans sp. INWT7]|uniref:hypothetical protein n=1 Tax=Glaciihabitans sp. INWT7 TaxID=2596912 RepID=UPI001CA48C40|nr:hypothetical protein [Glaciihabitans sp. INWT7]
MKLLILEAIPAVTSPAAAEIAYPAENQTLIQDSGAGSVTEWKTPQGFEYDFRAVEFEPSRLRR